ncbi:mannose-1-phosphate guanylyltransferase [Candidatus Dojkabacteria bacterium]|nr:mannose-1-phosphate guanylyltransferase [Candidatus Dojkabacteria bacterium]
MKIIIFAGGSGKRFWPISRKSLPKQFIPLFDNKSTFQLQIERAKEVVPLKEIFVSTNKSHLSLVKKQVPKLPKENIFLEPERRDLLAAFGYALVRIKHAGVGTDEPIIYLASDHLIKRPHVFVNSIKAAEKLILEDSNRFIYWGERPLYATNNLGWIHIGDRIKSINKIDVAKFKGWIYRPEIEKCRRMFKTGKWIWNVNYEMFTIDFALKKYKKHFPEFYKKIKIIEESLGTKQEVETVNKIYPTFEMLHSDELWKSAKPNEAVVLSLNLGWTDPGTLFALKQVLEESKRDNVTKGKVYNYQSKNCLVFNYEKSKFVATMNLEGMVVVNTKDAILVVDKDHVRFIGDMLKEFEGTKFEEYL